MPDHDVVAFLQWALPRNGMRWTGFRKVRRQVARRVRRRLVELGLDSLAAYRARLAADASEWAHFDAACRVTISRFYRDWGVWDALRAQVLPARAEDARRSGRAVLRAWSAGCASGEEPYTLALAWALDLGPRFPDVELSVVASDAGTVVLERARDGVYPGGALRELPPGWQEAGFEALPNGDFRLRDAIRPPVRFLLGDLRRGAPEGDGTALFDLVFCRHLASTYFDTEGQAAAARRLAAAMRPGALLVVGTHEQVPPDCGLRPHPELRWAWLRR